MTKSLREILLEVLHVNPRLPDPAVLGALSDEEWRILTDQAIRLRVAFQLSECVNADPRRRTLIPDACLDRLSQAVRTTLMRNMRQIMHLREMAGACAAAGVPVILLKGLWLTDRVYRDLRARASGDIDLLFRREDMPRFTRVARDLGFDLRADTESLCDLAPATNEFTLIHPERKSRFDIHWSLTHPLHDAPIDEDLFWRRSTIVDIAGTPCRTLRVEDHLVYLCYHTALHHYFQYVGPRALLDVARVIADPPSPIDWDDLTETARRMNYERGVWLVFDLVREHLGIRPPQAVIDALRPVANSEEVRNAATEAIFLDDRPHDSLPWLLPAILNEPSLVRSVALWRRMVPSRQELAARFRTRDEDGHIRWLHLRRWRSLLEHDLPKVVSLLGGNRKRAAELKRTRLIRRWLSN